MQAISDFIYVSQPGMANINVSTSIYKIESIQAATYQFTSYYHVLIIPNDGELITVIFEEKETGRDIVEDLKNFADSLNDYQVRLQLDYSNGKIRDLIVAHAFSPIDLKKETQSL